LTGPATVTGPGPAASGSTGVLLEVSGLEVRYGAAGSSAPAVRDASFTLARGELLGVAGESGCGKSTLAFAVARLLRGAGQVTGGSIRWNGRGGPADLVTVDEEKLRELRWTGISIVMQSAMNAMNPVLTLASQLDDVLRAHDRAMGRRDRARRIAALLEMVGIPARRATAYPHELSGGMRQRAMIALALALSPELVILDEPTTALDVVMQRQILEELGQLRADLGFAMLFITHDLSLLLEMADRILVMYAGTIVEKGTAAELYSAPLHPYTKGLLTSFPKLRGERAELLGIPGSPPSLLALPAGCTFHPRCSSVMDECRARVPALVPRVVAPGQGTPPREVACFLYDDAPRAAGQAEQEVSRGD